MAVGNVRNTDLTEPEECEAPIRILRKNSLK